MSRVIKYRLWAKPKGHYLDAMTPAFGYAMAAYLTGAMDSTLQRAEFDEQIVFEQWTGLLDKAGTEIYEGDILLDRREQFAAKWDDYSEVVWEANGWRLRGSKQNTHGWIGGHWTANSVVAGNVHQHPDLLKP